MISKRIAAIAALAASMLAVTACDTSSMRGRPAPQSQSITIPTVEVGTGEYVGTVCRMITKSYISWIYVVRPDGSFESYPVAYSDSDNFYGSLVLRVGTKSLLHSLGDSYGVKLLKADDPTAPNVSACENAPWQFAFGNPANDGIDGSPIPICDVFYQHGVLGVRTTKGTHLTGVKEYADDFAVGSTMALSTDGDYIYPAGEPKFLSTSECDALRPDVRNQ